jgi:glycolate oxidase
VPRYSVTQTAYRIKEIGNKYGFKSVCYGHASDGNLHVNIIKGGTLAVEYEGIREILNLLLP